MNYPGKRYLALTRERKKLLYKSLLLFIALRLFMGRVALKNIISFLSSQSNVEAQTPPSCKLDDILWSVHAVARRIPSHTCLMKALVTEYLLKKNGLACKLFIGVRKTAATELAAHAWVSVNGKIVIGNVENIDDYKPLPESELLKL